MPASRKPAPAKLSPGRPPSVSTEADPLRAVNIPLLHSQITWLRARGPLAATVRDLITQAMRRRK